MGLVPARDLHPGVCWSGCAILLPVPPGFLGGGRPPRGRAHRGADGLLDAVVVVLGVVFVVVVLAVVEFLAGLLSLFRKLLVGVPLRAD